MFTGSRQIHENFAAILLAAAPANGSAAREAVDELDGAVMLDAEARGELAHSGPDAFRHAFDRQQKLVLSRLKIPRAGLLLAEVEKTADLKAKLRQSAIVGQRKIPEALLILHIFVS